MNRKVRPRRTPRAAKRAAETLSYEFASLGDALDEYRKQKLLAPDHRTPLSNATLEAFLLHARNLRGFFRGTCNPDDILAIDWLTTPTSFPLPILENVRSDLDKLLAHPSYSRHKLRTKDWLYEQIYAELAHNWQRFLEQLAIDNPGLRDCFRS